MAYSTFDVDTVDHVLTIRFNRAQRRNSFTMRMCLELGALFEQVNTDDDVRVVIMTGEGPSFCAGADLDEGFLFEGQVPSPEVQEYMDVVGTIDGTPSDGGGWLSLKIARCLKPVIVAFNGSAVGVGVTMTLPADVRLAAESARFGLVFAKRGIVPEAASSWFLPRLVGISKAMEWVATGRIFSASEALEAGLVSYVVRDAELEKRARDLALEMVDGTSAVAVASARRMLWSMLGKPSPWDAHSLDSRGLYELAAAPDCAEGVSSFLEKRPAQFPMTISRDLPDFVPSWPDRSPDHTD